MTGAPTWLDFNFQVVIHSIHVNILSCFSCLPSDLDGAVRQSGQAGAEFVSSGGTRAIVSGYRG